MKSGKGLNHPHLCITLTFVKILGTYRFAMAWQASAAFMYMK